MKTIKFLTIKIAFLVFLTSVLVPLKRANGWVRGPNHEMAVGWQEPNEVDTITGNFSLLGDLYIINGGTLTIADANFRIEGNIYVVGDGSLIIKNSEFNILNGRDFQYDITVVDNGQLTFENSVLSTNRYSSHLCVRNQADAHIENSRLTFPDYAWLIAYFVDNSSLYVRDSGFPNEVIPDDSADIYIGNDNILANTIAIWLNFHYNVQADLHELLGPSERSNVSIQPDDPNINGIDYSIVTENAYIYWLINPGFFSDITIADSAVSLALFLYGYNGHDLVNMAPGYFSDYQLPLYDFERVVILKNTSIIFWQLYLAGVGNEWSETYRISDSEMNELLVFTETYVRLRNSVVGPAVLGTLYTGELSVTDSILKTLRLVAFNDSKISLEGCRLEGTPVIASDDSAIYLKNVEFAENTSNPLLPVGNQVSLNTFGAGRIYLANVDGINDTFLIGETVTITGSAVLHAGPDSSIDFKDYQFEYSMRGTDIWEPMGDVHVESVKDGELETWDTTGITEAGEYLLKLVNTDTNGGTFHAFGKVDLVSPASGSNPTVTLINDDCTGEYEIALVVNDSQVESAPDTVVITVADTTPPEITCPADVTVEQESYAGTVVPLQATATDNCDPNPVITSNELAIYPLGETVVTFTASDASGNSASCSMTVTVVDTNPPTINSVSASPDVLWPPNHKMAVVMVWVDATDICDPAPVYWILRVTSNEPINGPEDSNTEPDWELFADEPLVVLLRAESAGVGTGRVYTIHVECTDASGNTATATVDVTVPP
jgi:hypothetical protein